MIKRFLEEENKIIKFVLVDFLLCLSDFLIVVIIAVYMKEILFFKPSQIGFIIGIPAVICCFFSGLSYFFYRKLGVLSSVVLCFTMDITAYMIMLTQKNYILVLFSFILKGVSNSIFIPIFKNIYIESLNNKNNNSILFKVRYIIVCSSAIVAPILSKVIYPISKNIIFYICILASIISLLIMVISLHSSKIFIEVNNKKDKLINIILENKVFMIFVFGCILILTVFSQFEGTFAITLKDNALDIFSTMLILNSILGIFLQLLNIKVFSKISSFNSILIGCLFFSISFYTFWIFGENYFLLFISIFIFTLGETFVLPNLDVFITEISNDNNRIAYYSVSEIKRLGFFFGPFLSGYLIEKFSVNLMFASFSILGLLAALIFIFYKKSGSLFSQ